MSIKNTALLGEKSVMTFLLWMVSGSLLKYHEPKNGSLATKTQPKVGASKRDTEEITEFL